MKKNIQYFINEEKRVVVAKFSCDIANEVANEIESLCIKSQSSLGLSNQNEIFITSLNSILDMPKEKTLHAVARCHPNDIFDIEKGKEIAYKKLMIKYFNRRDKYLNEYLSVLTNVEERIKRSLEHNSNAKKSFSAF